MCLYVACNIYALMYIIKALVWPGLRLFGEIGKKRRERVYCCCYCCCYYYCSYCTQEGRNRARNSSNSKGFIDICTLKTSTSYYQQSLNISGKRERVRERERLRALRTTSSRKLQSIARNGHARVLHMSLCLLLQKFTNLFGFCEI